MLGLSFVVIAEGIPMSKLELAFHGTFILKKDEIKAILFAATQDKGLDVSLQELMSRTGLGNQKVKRIRSWAIRCGLISNNQLTPEGSLVIQKDPHLASDVTDWIMHFHLCFGNKGLQQKPKNSSDWGGWTYFVFDYLPRNSHFSEDELVRHLETIFTEDTKKSITTNIKKVLTAYTDVSALAGIQFLEKTGKEHYRAGLVKPPNLETQAYMLAKLWQRDYGDQTTVITHDLISDPMGLPGILGLSEGETKQEVQGILDKLEVQGILEQNRAVPPAQVVRRWQDPLEWLEKAYG